MLSVPPGLHGPAGFLAPFRPPASAGAGFSCAAITMTMPDKNENSTTWRADIMRRMAAIHAELHRLWDTEMSAEDRDAKTRELKKRLTVLMKKFLG
jgi:hypothetical protein